MKKVALSLLAFAMVGASAFAQAATPTFTMGGYLDVGTNTSIMSDSGMSTIVKGDDTGAVGGSYDFKGAFALSPSAGVKFDIRFVNLMAAAGVASTYSATGPTVSTSLSGMTLAPQNAYVYFNVPGAEMVKVLAGNIDGSGWGGNDDKGANVSGGSGVQVQVTPVAGFTLGGQVAPAGVGANNVYSAGATYAIDKVATVVGGVKTGSDKDGKVAANVAYVTASVSAIDKLTLKAGLNLEGLSTDKKDDTVIDATVGYALTDALSATLTSYVWTYGSNIKTITTASTAAGDAAALSFKVNPSVSYTVSPLVSVGFGGTYQSGASIAGTADSNGNNTTINKISKIEVNPNATFTIDANTKVYVNYLYDALSGDDTKNGKDLTAQTFKVDFRYTF